MTITTTAPQSAPVGAALGAGGAWSYVFVVPYLSANAAALANESTRSMLILTIGVACLAKVIEGGVTRHRA